MLKLRNISSMYIDGFKNMKVGKTLWKIVFIKIFLILIVLNYFIYDKSIKTQYKTDDEKSAFVYENLRGK